MRITLACLLAIGCAGAHGGGGEATFRVFYPDMPATGFRATAGKRFFIKPVGECTYGNGRDARWAMTGARLASGELPEGLSLEDGAIGGTAKRPGTYRVTVEFSGVTCAGAAHDPQTVDVTIVVQ